MKEYDAIIIGAGMAGLMSAALISRNNKVLVIEKSRIIGGRASNIKLYNNRPKRESVNVSYGPHILPANGFAERTLKELGLKKKLRFVKLKLPVFVDDQSALVVPNSLTDIKGMLKVYLELRKKIKRNEIIGFIKLGIHAFFENEKNLIEKYENTSSEKLLSEFGISSKNATTLAKGINGGYNINDNLSNSPALDFIINMKLFMLGMMNTGTLMYHVEGGYGQIFEVLKNYIERNGGKVLLGKKVKFIKKNNEVNVILNNKPIYSKNIIFTGTPRQLKQILPQNKSGQQFLEKILSVSEAKILNSITVTKKRIHKFDTSWVSVLVDDEFGYVIIEDDPTKNGPFIYHLCVISHNKKNPSRLMARIKTDLKRFGFDFKNDVKWSRTVEMTAYGAEKNLSLPLSKRPGPETPYSNLFWIGDFKGLTVGTDGCVLSAIRLSNKLFDTKINDKL